MYVAQGRAFTGRVAFREMLQYWTVLYHVLLKNSHVDATL